MILPSPKLAIVAIVKENDINIFCKRYQVMDFVRVGMNAASVGNEFGTLLRRVTSETSFEIYEKSSYNFGARRKKTKEKEKKTKRKEREQRNHLKLTSNL